MNEPPEAAPRHAWEERPAFRELFLLHAPPLAAEALRETGRHLYDALLECGFPEPAEPWVRSRVRALAEDLRFTGQVLASLGDAPVYAGLTAEEFALAVKADAWAAEVTALVQAMDRALGRAEESS
jgi:hypothetical protein